MTDAALRPSALTSLPGVEAGFTTRTFAAADEPLDAGRARLAEATGMAVASVGQVHGADVAVVGEAGHVPAHDGLVTSRAGLLLTTIAADCALVLLADAEAGVVGACHSGWRGTVAHIVERTADKMVGLGADPGRLVVALGPCISAEAFEVGEEVADQFPASSVVRRPEWPRPHVDLGAEVRRQLVEAGVAGERVEALGVCTAGDGRFYSYRAEGGTRGRMFGFVGRRG